MSKPLLSVCLLTYNQAPYVKEALDSIVTQETDFAWELFIADDASTDGTREILLEYKKKFPELIKLILQKANKGPEANWLDLMEAPKTRYVLYAEGDDYFTDPHKLQKQVDFLKAHPDCSICFHPVKVVYQDDPRRNEIFPTPEQRFNKKTLSLKDLLQNNFIQTNSAMYRWRYAKGNIKDGYPWGITPGDWYLHILHAEQGKIGFIDEPMAVYRKHSAGLWADAENNQKRFWKKYGITWLQFYRELLKMYGSNPQYRPIIEGSMINLLNSLDKIDDLFRQAIAAVPEAAEIYIDNLRQQVSALHQHSNKQGEVINNYSDTEQRLREENQQLHHHNRRLMNKPLVKLEYAVKRRVKRKPS